MMGEEEAHMVSCIADVLDETGEVEVPFRFGTARRLQQDVLHIAAEADSLLSRGMDPCHRRESLQVRCRGGVWFAHCHACDHVEEAETYADLCDAWESWRERA